MRPTDSILVVLGGSGFIGSHVIAEAVATGSTVKALVRSAQSAKVVEAQGATAFLGDAERPQDWIRETEGAHAIVDLLQPTFPRRLGRAALARIAAQRLALTRGLVAALGTVAEDRRPILIAVSGIDDLAPDQSGHISAASPQRTTRYGFNPIGIPVRRAIEQSGVSAAFAYLGTVYGPGKAFAESVFPSIAAGTWKNFGRPSDRTALVHVEDAARGLVRIAQSEPAHIRGRSFVISDGDPTGLNDFYDLAARLMGARAPSRVPGWLASLVAGPALIETSVCNTPVTPSPEALPREQFRYPSYREGLPATLAALKS
jgi:nucleoside-diphosphate-sugar epimerase